MRVGGAKSAARSWDGPAARTLITVGAAVIVAGIAGKVPARWAPFVVLAAPLVVLILVLVRRMDPKWFLAALVVSTFLGWFQFSTSVGRVNVRLTDLPYLVLVGSVLFVSGRTRAQRADIGQRPLAVLLLVFGLSLIPVLVVDPNGFFSPFVSWARLVETFSIVLIMPYVVKRPSDARFVMGMVAAACTIELGRALIDEIVRGQLSDRLVGGNGPDTEGLLAAVLIVTVLYGMVPRRPLARAALIGLGVLSLVMSRSVGSIAAVGLVLAFAPLPRRAAHSRRAGLLRPIKLVVALTIVVVVVVAVRSANVPGEKGFSNGSTMARIIAGAAGLDLFAHHPIFGVGFSRSELPQVLADPTINSDLHRAFPNAPADLFPAVSECLIEHQSTGLTGTGPTSSCQVGSVHNAYIQVAAEEGLIGLLTLIAIALVIRRRVRSLRAHTRDPAILATLRWATLVLIVVLIWWNDNPLYGGQPETLLAALALGTLAVPWSSLGADSQSSLGGGRPIRLSARSGTRSGPHRSDGHASDLGLSSPG
jgi:O-antigen ligase